MKIMKKIILVLTMATLASLPVAALAKDQGGGFQGGEPLAKQGGGGYTGGGAESVTVAEAMKRPDDAWVSLTGKITNQIGHEKYQFSDGTGSITVDIDDKRWRGLTVGPDDTVIILGEVDRDFKSLEIDVQRISKK